MINPRQPLDQDDESDLPDDLLESIEDTPTEEDDFGDETQYDDEYAVEEALKIVEAGEGEVTVLTMGPEQAAEAVKKSLQMGAHAGVHVQDDAIAGSDAVGTSLVLAKAIEKIGAPDVVMCGMASTDASGGVVPAMLAERLGLPQVTLASVVETQGDQVRIKRDGDTATEVIGGTLPLVLSVTDQSDAPVSLVAPAPGR